MYIYVYTYVYILLTFDIFHRFRGPRRLRNAGGHVLHILAKFRPDWWPMRSFRDHFSNSDKFGYIHPVFVGVFSWLFGVFPSPRTFGHVQDHFLRILTKFRQNRWLVDPFCKYSTTKYTNIHKHSELSPYGFRTPTMWIPYTYFLDFIHPVVWIPYIRDMDSKNPRHGFHASSDLSSQDPSSLRS